MDGASQKKSFLADEGDAWYRRNFAALSDREKVREDPIVKLVKDGGLKPRAILEIGAANGWRLGALHELTGARCFGLDPSETAVLEGRKTYPKIDLAIGTADLLPLDDDSVDLVIFGFCLYLCDRRDLFKIAAEADRVLRSPGHVAIIDFDPHAAYRNPYAHKAGLFSYKMDYCQLFLWHPAYHLVAKTQTPLGALDAGVDPDSRVGASLIAHNDRHAFPEKPIF